MELTSKLRINYGLQRLMEMTSKSRSDHDNNTRKVMCAVQHWKHISRKIIFDMENQIPKIFTTYFSTDRIY